MHEAGLMDAGEPGRHADGQGLELRAGGDAVLGHEFKQRLARYVLADQIGVGSVEAGVQHPGGAERRYPLGDGGLGSEAVQGRRVPVASQDADADFGAVGADGGEDRIVGWDAAQPAREPVAPDPPRVARL